MADFKCEPGKVLTRQETEAMLNYDEAGMARPEEYADVVFDATSIQGAVYRCRTDAEMEAVKSRQAARDATQARQEAIDALKMERREQLAKDLGVDPASLPIDLAPTATFNAAIDGQPVTGAGQTDTTDADTGSTSGRRSRSS